VAQGSNEVVVSRRDRVAGGLLGVHAGDALGATVEFSSWASIRDRYPDGVTDIVGGGPFGWPPGHATDDTDLTRAVLLAYLTRRSGPPAGVVARLPRAHGVGQVRHSRRRLRTDRLQRDPGRVHALEQSGAGAEQHR
jgi:hypothetical protein